MQNRKNGSPKNLAKFLKDMNRVEKNVACLYYFENLTVSDIAKVLKENERFVQGLLEKFMMKISHKFSRTQSVTKRVLRQSK